MQTVPVKVGINGFGSIGRRFLRAALTRDDIEVVAVNATRSPEMLAHLLKYDSTYGTLHLPLEHDGDALIIDGRRIPVLHGARPDEIDWGAHGVSVVAETTGHFNDRDKAAGHLAGGAKKVVISAAAKNADCTIVMGVNQQVYDPQAHNVISNASCTTNCLAPVAKVVSQHFGVVRGLMTTVHAYTRDQGLLDGSHKDFRRARAAGQSIIPTTTGAAKAIGLVLPELAGKLNGYAVRVPTPTVSLLDLVVDVERPVTVAEVNTIFKSEANGALKGILGYSDEPLVSVDYKGSADSAIVDGLSTMAIGNMLKVVAWYDNEWAYSLRLADLAAYVGKTL
ncbi:MAG: type I glyceraldehyde-3-phosphate dehydrogenase [Chloroflexota bacterium]